MIVLDASVLANVVGDDGGPGARARALVGEEESLAGPDLVDVETVSVLRRRWLAGTLDERRFEQAVADLIDFPLVRFPTFALMRRAFELRANVTAHDACYVALAELLECPLVTADGRLARAPGLRCPVRLVVDQPHARPCSSGAIPAGSEAIASAPAAPSSSSEP